MLGIVREALTSEIGRLVDSGSALLASLYRVSGPQLADHFDEFYQLVQYLLLLQEKETREGRPVMIGALARMFEGLGKNPEVAEPYAADLFELLQKLREADADLGTPKDVRSADTLFQVLADLYRVFAKLFWPHIWGYVDRQTKESLWAREREYLLELSRFAQVIMRLQDVSDGLLREFARMAEQFGERCTPRNNVVLNRMSVHRLLEAGLGNARTGKVRQTCRNVLLQIRSKWCVLFRGMVLTLLDFFRAPNE
jgi:hypothetical protein